MFFHQVCLAASNSDDARLVVIFSRVMIGKALACWYFWNVDVLITFTGFIHDVLYYYYEQ